MTLTAMDCFDLPLFDVGDVAQMFAVSPRTISRWIEQGLIDYRKMGRLVRFTETDIERFIERIRVAAES